MTRRERILFWVVVGVLAVFATDRLALSPLTDAFADMRQEAAELERRLHDANVLIGHRDSIEKRRAAYDGAGLADPVDAARIGVQQRLEEYSRAAGLSLDTLSTGRVVRGERFDQVGFNVSATGSIGAVQQFLWSIRMAPFPLRVKKFQIASRDEKQDRLNVSLQLSTITVIADEGSAQVAGVAVEGGQ